MAARSILRYTLKSLQPADTLYKGPPYFLVPWGIVSHGYLIPMGLRPSDLELYLLLAVAEYMLATRDVSILNETVAMYGAGQRPQSVAQLLQRVWDYRFHDIGVGQHGLLRVQGSDWSDSFCDKVPGCAFNNSLWWQIYEHGESVLNTAIAVYMTQRYAAALRLAGPAFADQAANVSAQGDQLAQAMREHTMAQTGQWVRRSWLPSVGWQGDTVMEISQQSWHVLGNVFNASFNRAMATFARQNLSDPSPIGAAIMGYYYPNAPPYGHQVGPTN